MHGSDRTCSTSSGTPSVTSRSVRVHTRTVSPSRWTWIRAPSSLCSTVTSGPSEASASSSDEPGLASMGRTGRPTSSRTAASASSPPARAVAATVGQAARQHERAAQHRGGDAGRGRDRVEHHALERALAQLAGEQPDEEGLLLGRGRAEQPGQQRPRAAPRTRRRTWRRARRARRRRRAPAARAPRRARSGSRTAGASPRRPGPAGSPRRATRSPARPRRGRRRRAGRRWPRALAVRARVAPTAAEVATTSASSTPAIVAAGTDGGRVEVPGGSRCGGQPVGADEHVLAVQPGAEAVVGDRDLAQHEPLGQALDVLLDDDQLPGGGRRAPRPGTWRRRPRCAAARRPAGRPTASTVPVATHLDLAAEHERPGGGRRPARPRPAPRWCPGPSCAATTANGTVASTSRRPTRVPAGPVRTSVPTARTSRRSDSGVTSRAVSRTTSPSHVSPSARSSGGPAAPGRGRGGGGAAGRRPPCGASLSATKADRRGERRARASVPTTPRRTPTARSAVREAMGRGTRGGPAVTPGARPRRSHRAGAGTAVRRTTVARHGEGAGGATPRAAGPPSRPPCFPLPALPACAVPAPRPVGLLPTGQPSHPGAPPSCPLFGGRPWATPGRPGGPTAALSRSRRPARAAARRSS